MKKLVSVLGSIIVGMNIGAVDTNAIGVSTRSQARNKAEIFNEIMSKYAFDSDCIENEGWTLFYQSTKRHEIAREAKILMCNLEEAVGLFDFKPKAAECSELRATLHQAIRMGLFRACYCVPDELKKEGRWIFTKEYYQIFENKENIRLVKENLPEFLTSLSTYLNSKEAKKKNALKTKMKNSLGLLPEILS